MSTEILVLLVLFQFKHLIADYYLQFPYMYLNKGKEQGWFWPLTHHANVHAAFTLVIIGFYSQGILVPIGAMIFDFVTHFITDRWKATRGLSPDTEKFWINLGIDQMVHHIVGIIIIYAVTC
jgi:hypothetical protein